MPILSRSFEDAVIRGLGRTMPVALTKRLPALYYAVNRYRFRFLRRPVMTKETSKAHERRRAEGFFAKYFNGHGIDVGYGGDLVIPNCRGWDIENGDAHELAGIPDAVLDFVYSSHLLEHLQDPARALRNWWRVLKPGGYLILYVPDRDLFERRQTLPSDFSTGHKHFFLLDRDDPPDTIGLIPLFRRELPGADVVYAKICDAGYCRGHMPMQMIIDVEYSIEVVAQKRDLPPSEGAKGKLGIADLKKG